MGMRKVNIIYVVCVLLCCLGLPACKKNIGLTTVSVADSVRHYYPLIAGQVLNLSRIRATSLLSYATYSLLAGVSFRF